MSERTILVGFDGSDPANKALELARDLAHRYDAAVHLVHVIDWSPFEFHTQQENENQAKERRDQMEKDRQELFPPILERLRAESLEAEAEVRWGHPAEILCDRASELAAFMVVIGRTGQSSLKSLLFGSVASRTVQLSECPVIVVP